MFQIDVNTLSIFGLLFLFFLLVLRLSNKQKNNVKLALRQQDEANRLLRKMVDEIQVSNQCLAKLAGIDPQELETESSSEAKLYVGNIDYSASEEELEALFARFGKVEMVNIPVNRYNGKARGFGFVTFASANDAQNALDLNGSEFKGRQLLVNYAKDRG